MGQIVAARIGPPVSEHPVHINSRISRQDFTGQRGLGDAAKTARAALAHPFALIAAAALLLNALVWQPLWPSWWTGKIGDVAWLVIVPLLAAVPLSAARPLRRVSPRSFAAVVCSFVALGFALAKAVPVVNAAVLSLGASLGVALKLRLDPTDLLALPAVLVAWRVWQHPPPRPRRAVQAAALALAALAVMADVAAPQDFGFDCLVNAAPTYYAIREVYQPSDIGNGSTTKKIYRSDDGGLTWKADSQFDASKAFCSRNSDWPVADPSDKQVLLYYVPGKGIYRSADQGQSLELEQPLNQAPAYLVDEAAGNLIVAAGTQGIWVKTPARAWRQTLNLPKP
jgi:hypothetical protein